LCEGGSRRGARERGLIEIATWNPRDFASDNYRSADDRCYGGGPGVVMMIDPLRKALDSVRRASGSEHGKAIYMSPQGARLDQAKVEALAKRDHLILLCGRYEGVDERFIEHAVEEEISVGDYVLSGGELAAAIVIDAVGRLQDGVLHDAQSAQQDSFSDGLLDCPHYTRPEHHDWGVVPAVLTSGDHAAIARWRMKQSLGDLASPARPARAGRAGQETTCAAGRIPARARGGKTTHDRDSGSGE
jgi:tRNA (guanine37-N1)-methyltransferase